MNRIRISGIHYDQLRKHLFPGDNKEAVAVALCGRSKSEDNHTLLVKELLLIPYDACYERRDDFVHWPTSLINPLLEKASGKNYAILKIHCHPGYYEKFSDIDNESDYSLFTSIHAWLDDDLPHGSCIMLPDGRLFGRFFNAAIQPEIVQQISVTGSDIYNWFYNNSREVFEELHLRNMQTFGKKTVALLNKLKIGVVGCSGTGSPVIEQLKRLGVGELVLVDPDFIDKLNLNRIIGSTLEDAKQKRMKVDIMTRGIEETGFGTLTKSFPSIISSRQVVKELAECDILFSCVDGAEGRHILNMISAHYLIPLFDMGVKLQADGNGGIQGIFGSVHFIQAGGSSLLSRGQYNLDTLRSEAIKRTNKEEYEKNRYLAQVNEYSPAVISINMQVAATAINEFLSRIHPYRNMANSDVDIVRIMFGDCTTYYESDSEPCPYFSKLIGKGDIEPLLNNPELSNVTKAA
ncbi:MAG: ThiF family adenylyltransferase [Bacteroidota bacterium]